MQRFSITGKLLAATAALLMLAAAPLYGVVYLVCWFVFPGGRRSLDELFGVFDGVGKRDERMFVQ